VIFYRPMTRKRLLNLPDGTVLQSGLTNNIYTKTRGRLIRDTGGFIAIEHTQQESWCILEEPTNNEGDLWV
jgi:hypothetical protein